MADGRRQLPRLYLPGEICTIDAVHGAPVAGLLPGTDCRFAAVSLAWVRAVVAEQPSVRDLVGSLAAREIAVMTEQSFSLGRRSARERTTFFLCDVFHRLDARGEAADGSFRLPLTQVDMGDHLGLSTVHINRTLQDLRSAGLIRHIGRTFTILDRDALEHIVVYRHGTGPATDLVIRRA